MKVQSVISAVLIVLAASDISEQQSGNPPTEASVATPLPAPWASIFASAMVQIMKNLAKPALVNNKATFSTEVKVNSSHISLFRAKRGFLDTSMWAFNSGLSVLASYSKSVYNTLDYSFKKAFKACKKSIKKIGRLFGQAGQRFLNVGQSKKTVFFTQRSKRDTEEQDSTAVKMPVMEEEEEEISDAAVQEPQEYGEIDSQGVLNSSTVSEAITEAVTEAVDSVTEAVTETDTNTEAVTKAADAVTEAVTETDTNTEAIVEAVTEAPAENEVESTILSAVADVEVDQPAGQPTEEVSADPTEDAPTYVNVVDIEHQGALYEELLEYQFFRAQRCFAMLNKTKVAIEELMQAQFHLLSALAAAELF